MENTAVDTILGAVPTLTTLMGKVFDLMVANPVLVLYVASTFIGIGVGVLVKVKRAAKK